MDEKRPNIFITGVNSKLAAPIIDKLKKSHTIIATTRNIKTLTNPIQGIEYLELDLINEITYNGEIDYIIHLASFVPYNHEETSETFETSFINNVTMTNNVLKLAVNKKVKKILYASSIDVYGDTHNNFVFEKDTCTPTNYYGLSKIASEDLMNVYFNNYNISYSIFRISYVLANTMDDSRFLKSLLHSIKQSKDLSLYNPDNILNLIDVNEIATVFEKSLVGANGVYNLSKHISLSNFVDLAKKQFQSTSKITYINNETPTRQKLSNKKLIQFYGDIFTSFEESIVNTMKVKK